MTIDAVVERKVERVADGENLLENLKLIRPDSWETSQEVFKAWQNGTTDKEGVSTANIAVYRLENGEAVFELLGKEGNPFIDKSLREDAYNGIVQNEFFFPQGAMKKLIKSASAKVTIRYSGLNIKSNKPNDGDGYVEFNGKNTSEEITLFEGVYGTANPGNGKKVYLLKESVVKAQLKNEDDVVVLPCYLYHIQDFDASEKVINVYISAVRGVRLESVAEGDEPQKDGVAPEETDKVGTAYASLLDVKNRDEALRLMKEKPELAIGLLGLLIDHLDHYKTPAKQ
ncbi:hypothetical protein HYU06_02505 [Candidatus Woesearchaeota archaeon]|nr:hypothetical protein [Candidatus Woesearchaeota archaeon]